jgi:hypothetical protein
MERSFEFCEVTNYDFDVKGADLVLKLFQGDIITHIRIFADGMVNSAGNLRPKKTLVAARTVSAALAPAESTSDESATAVVVATLPATKALPRTATKFKTSSLTRLTADQVKEIRANWEDTVKACGTKNAAAIQLAKVYNCSPKNIYAIIYRYSWSHI